ncbi:MAG: hypothetical protein JSU77_05420 [Fidelibacterota bacterium]|nr:MAG: hypothetical protein JSU77_05420 [Candidatus Neomarinimicrobiota bacterium]
MNTISIDDIWAIGSGFPYSILTGIWHQQRKMLGSDRMTFRSGFHN